MVIKPPPSILVASWYPASLHSILSKLENENNAPSFIKMFHFVSHLCILVKKKPVRTHNSRIVLGGNVARGRWCWSIYFVALKPWQRCIFNDCIRYAVGHNQIKARVRQSIGKLLAFVSIFIFFGVECVVQFSIPFDLCDFDIKK